MIEPLSIYKLRIVVDFKYLSFSINWGFCIWKFQYMMLCSALRSQIQSWLRDYDKIQYLAVIFIYIQIGCALIGSLGALYNGVLVIHLAISLFALVAIESSSQSLGRTYAVLLFCTILLDIFWFILFTHEIWNMSSVMYGAFVIFSVKITLSMQIIGFLVRLLSSSLWVQMYRLGVSNVDSSAPREADFDMRNSFLSPATPAINRHSSDCDDVLGGSIYDPAYYSSLFEDGPDNGHSCGGCNHGIGQGGSTSTDDGAFLLKPSEGRYSQVIKDENVISKFQNV
ncbi:hypothetical protein ACSBR2_021476 [Camellia fascicularis]